jgi:ribonucleoside-diphosphate reductase alpha chain
VEYTDSEEEAVCNLASLSLPAYFKDGDIDHDLLADKVRELVRNLNRVIDVNYYPTPKTEKSNFRHRPIGIGYQGLADLFALAKTPFDSEKARRMNREFAETIYYAALESSVEEAKIHGPYETFPGSPISQGLLQFDLWGVTPTDRHDWNRLREQIKVHGVRNSLLIAPMPTASTAQVLGNYECFEPFGSNASLRETLSGTHWVVNHHLVRDLKEQGLWSDEFSRQLLAARGSIQGFAHIPEEIRLRYRTVWEIPQRSIIEMAADRAAFTCQTQSMNLYFKDPTTSKIASAMMLSWSLGLKTGSYYTRVPEAAPAVAFTVGPNMASAPKLEAPTEEEIIACSINNPEACELCSG